MKKWVTFAVILGVVFALEVAAINALFWRTFHGPDYGKIEQLRRAAVATKCYEFYSETPVDLTPEEHQFIMDILQGRVGVVRGRDAIPCYDCEVKGVWIGGEDGLRFDFLGPDGDYLGYRAVYFTGPPFQFTLNPLPGTHPQDEGMGFWGNLSTEDVRVIARLIALASWATEEQVVEMAECADDCPDARGRSDYGANVDKPDDE